ncbi:MAG: hypothetical protein WA891_02995 [Acidobacteriaceae bacterium]
MQPLSPVDAISPAFSRARTILLPPGPAPGLNAPFRFWFFLRIAVTAALTESNIYGMVFGFAFEAVAIVAALAAGAAGVNGHLTHSPFSVAGGLSAPAIAVILLVLLFAFALALVFAWLWCRLRFTLFDLVVCRHGLVSRAWSPYASQAWRFLGLNILIGLALLLCLAVTAGPLVLHLVLALRHLTPQQINADPLLLMSHIFPLYGILFLFVFAAHLVNAVTQDFILPPMALEDAPLGTSFARFFHLLRTRFWYVALYMLLRFVLELGLVLVGSMALFIVLAVLGAGGAGIGFILYRAFWHAGPGGVALFVIYCVLAGLIVIAAYLLMILVLYGIIAVVRQSYAAYFYGSYYPQLGDRLEPLLIPPQGPFFPPNDPFPPTMQPPATT